MSRACVNGVKTAFDPKTPSANQVGMVTSTAERQAAIEFAKAAAMRPRIVGTVPLEIARDRFIARVNRY